MWEEMAVYHDCGAVRWRSPGSRGASAVAIRNASLDAEAKDSSSWQWAARRPPIARGGYIYF